MQVNPLVYLCFVFFFTYTQLLFFNSIIPFYNYNPKNLELYCLYNEC